MDILAIEIKLYASWVQSLKEKRMIVKSIIGKLRNKFNVSVAEIDTQDVHKTITIGIVAIVDNVAYADQLADAIENFVECNTDAQIVELFSEIR